MPRTMQAAGRLLMLLLGAMPSAVISFATISSQTRALRMPVVKGTRHDASRTPGWWGLVPRLRVRVTSLAAAGGKGGKVQIPYREGGGGASDVTPEAKAYVEELRRKAASSGEAGGEKEEKKARVRTPGLATTSEALKISAEDIRRKVEAAQKAVSSGDETIEEFVSDFNLNFTTGKITTDVRPEEDVVLEGRIPTKWLKVDFSICMGKGGYGDVYEA
jgi:hypothetical protein